MTLRVRASRGTTNSSYPSDVNATVVSVVKRSLPVEMPAIHINPPLAHNPIFKNNQRLNRIVVAPLLTVVMSTSA
jgi:hypothetical protein